MREKRRNLMSREFLAQSSNIASTINLSVSDTCRLLFTLCKSVVFYNSLKYIYGKIVNFRRY